MDLKYLYCEHNRIRRLAFASEAKLFELGCTGNSFGFSQIPDRMQAAVVNGSIGDDTPVSLWYQPPFDPGTGDLLDLSGELFSAAGAHVDVAVGSTPSLAARQPGVYILRLTDGAGRTQAVKLRLE